MSNEFDFNLNDFKFDSTDFNFSFEVDEGKDYQDDILILNKVKRYPNRVCYEYAEDFAKKLPEIGENEAVFAIVSGAFILGDVIEAIAVQRNYKIKELTIATLSLSVENVDSLINLKKGDYLDKLNLLVSDYWFAHERREGGGVPYIIDNLYEPDIFSMGIGRIHTKIFLIETECGKFYCCHGSANLRSSDNIEQICIENNKELYRFNYDWINRVINQYQVTSKSLRGRKLWQTVTEQIKKTD